MSEKDASGRSGRWQRRDSRRRAERSRLARHGAGLRRVYLDAVRKRLAKMKDGSRSES